MGWLEDLKWQRREASYKKQLVQRKNKTLRDQWRKEENALPFITDTEVNSMVELYASHAQGGLFQDEYNGWKQEKDRRDAMRYAQPMERSLPEMEQRIWARVKDFLPDGTHAVFEDWRDRIPNLLASLPDQSKVAPESVVALEIAFTILLTKRLKTEGLPKGLVGTVNVSVGKKYGSSEKGYLFKIVIDRPQLAKYLLTQTDEERTAQLTKLNTIKGCLNGILDKARTRRFAQAHALIGRVDDEEIPYGNGFSKDNEILSSAYWLNKKLGNFKLTSGYDTECQLRPRTLEMVDQESKETHAKRVLGARHAKLQSAANTTTASGNSRG